MTAFSVGPGGACLGSNRFGQYIPADLDFYRQGKLDLDGLSGGLD